MQRFCTMSRELEIDDDNPTLDERTKAILPFLGTFEQKKTL